MSEPRELCPNCGSDRTERDAVDIGVGTVYGPLCCFDCGWSEPRYDAADEPPVDGPETPDDSC